MPKRYSEEEKRYIQKRLKEEAAKCLAQYGVRRTTVDEIVKRVNIPKGTFYLFYQSKELLLFDVIMEQHNLLEQEMYKAVSCIEPSTCTREQLTDIIFHLFKKADEMPILRILNSEEVALLARKLPPDVLKEHLEQDSTMIDQVFSNFLKKTNINENTISAAFRAIYFTSLHKAEISKDNYDQALYVLIYGLVAQLM